MEHSRANQYKTSGVEYYAKDSQCNYKWVPASNGQFVENAIQYYQSPYTFYVGRIFKPDTVIIGKAPRETNVMYYCYKNHCTDIRTYEVLICEKLPCEIPILPSTTSTTTPKSVLPSQDYTNLNVELMLENRNLKKEIETMKANLMAKLQENSDLQAKCNIQY